MTSDTKQYLKDIKVCFPVFKKDERKFYNQLKKEILSLDEECTYSDYLSKFGFPKDIVMNYYDDIESDKLFYKIKNIHIIKIISITLFTIILVFNIAYWCSIKLANYQFDNKEIIIHEKTILKDKNNKKRITYEKKSKKKVKDYLH